MGRQAGLRRAAMLAAVFAAATLGADAGASFHTFQIAELYSSPDGNIQFVELHEFLGFNGEQFLASHTLTSKQGATTRTYTFPTNLPDGNTANKRELIATAGFAARGTPFLFPGGGTIDYAGVDVINYPALGAAALLALSALVALGALAAFGGRRVRQK